MVLIIHGAPRTKKNHGRRIKRGRRIFHVPSEAHETWASAAVLQLRSAMRTSRVLTIDKTPGRESITVGWGETLNTPVNVRALIYRDANRGDAVGYYQAIADALEAAGVVENDRLCVSWDGSRMLVDRHAPRIEIELTAAT